MCKKMTAQIYKQIKQMLQDSCSVAEITKKTGFHKTSILQVKRTRDFRGYQRYAAAKRIKRAKDKENLKKLGRIVREAKYDRKPYEPVSNYRDNNPTMLLLEIILFLFAGALLLIAYAFVSSRGK